MRRLALAALAAAALSCAGGRARPYPPLPAGLGDAAARESLARFAAALDGGRFEEAHALLSSRWRAAYTPGRLALDFGGAGASAKESAGRVLAALRAGAPLERDGSEARLPRGPRGVALLVAEGGAWRVDALE